MVLIYVVAASARSSMMLSRVSMRSCMASPRSLSCHWSLRSSVYACISSRVCSISRRAWHRAVFHRRSAGMLQAPGLAGSWPMALSLWRSRYAACFCAGVIAIVTLLYHTVTLLRKGLAGVWGYRPQCGAQRFVFSKEAYRPLQKQIRGAAVMRLSLTGAKSLPTETPPQKHANEVAAKVGCTNHV